MKRSLLNSMNRRWCRREWMDGTCIRYTHTSRTVMDGGVNGREKNSACARVYERMLDAFSHGNADEELRLCVCVWLNIACEMSDA